MTIALAAFMFAAGLSLGFVLGCLACVHAVDEQDKRIRAETEAWFVTQKQNGGDET